MASLASSIELASQALLAQLQEPGPTHCDEASGEHFHRQLLEALPAAIYTTDAAGRITFYNRAAVEFSGRRPETGSDQWCVTWRLYWPDGRPMAYDECPMARALKEDRPIQGEEAIAEQPTERACRSWPTRRRSMMLRASWSGQ
jgi:PAS domain S-box-containing protein